PAGRAQCYRTCRGQVLLLRSAPDANRTTVRLPETDRGATLQGPVREGVGRDDHPTCLDSSSVRDRDSGCRRGTTMASRTRLCFTQQVRDGRAWQHLPWRLAKAMA